MIEIKYDTSLVKKARIITDKKVRQQAIKIVTSSGFAVESKAKELAPVDTGMLVNKIQMTKPDPFTARITAGTNYAESIEMGQKPGTWPHMGALRLWAKRVLGDPSLAMPIAASIFIKGREPRPFLRPAFNKERPKFIRKIKKLFVGVTYKGKK
ncbi:MAG: hypothetical protein GC193_13185 [Cryomorphaceae bacterium]|nr:hypothetical protein [Cryomorphaceae bacterium]